MASGTDGRGRSRSHTPDKQKQRQKSKERKGSIPRKPINKKNIEFLEEEKVAKELKDPPIRVRDGINKFLFFAFCLFVALLIPDPPLTLPPPIVSPLVLPVRVLNPIHYVVIIDGNEYFV